MSEDIKQEVIITSPRKESQTKNEGQWNRNMWSECTLDNMSHFGVTD